MIPDAERFHVWFCSYGLGERARMLQKNFRFASVAVARKHLRKLAGDKAHPQGKYWLEDGQGVPVYGILAYDEPKRVRVPVEGRPHPSGTGHYGSGYLMREVPGETVRVLKPGNMPWAR